MWGQRVNLLFAATNVFDHPDTRPSLTLLLFASVAFRGCLLLPIEAYQLEAFDVSFRPTHDGGIHTGLRRASFFASPASGVLSAFRGVLFLLANNNGVLFPPSAELFFSLQNTVEYFSLLK